MSEIKTPASVDQVRDFVGWLFLTKLSTASDRDGHVATFATAIGAFNFKDIDDFYDTSPMSSPHDLIYDLLMQADDRTLRALYYFGIGFARWQPNVDDLFYLGHAYERPSTD